MNELQQIMKRLRRRGFDYICIEQTGDGFYRASCEQLDNYQDNEHEATSNTMLRAMRHLEDLTKAGAK